MHSQHIYKPVLFAHKMFFFVVVFFFNLNAKCLLGQGCLWTSSSNIGHRTPAEGLSDIVDPSIPRLPNYPLLERFLLSPNWSHLFHVIWTTSFSMSSASPFSRGSAIIVILFLRRETVAISPRNDGNGSNWQDLRDCTMP